MAVQGVNFVSDEDGPSDCFLVSPLGSFRCHNEERENRKTRTVGLM